MSINYQIRFKQLLPIWLKHIFAAFCFVLILAGFALITNQINCTRSIFRPTYSSHIIDKSLTFSETQMGSRIKRRLLIESKEGERFEVIVTEVVFNKAQIGEWVKADEEKTEFSEKELK